MSSGWGAIFDFDGVIADSEKHHEVCWQKVAHERGALFTRELYKRGFGVKNERFISEILGWTKDQEEIQHIAKRKEEVFEEYAEQHEVSLIPGVLDFVEELAECGVPLAIASSSIRKNIEILLKRSPIRAFFSHIVSAEDVTHGKPHPEVFLLAAERLLLPPERCVVFEDALLGVMAANLAGTKSVAITTTFPKERFEALELTPGLIITKFDKCLLAEVKKWF
jgi:beta-phosphoglucomutase family hydrolase